MRKLMGNALAGVAAAGFTLWLAMAPATAAGCGTGPGGFNSWLSQFKQEMKAKGVATAPLDSVSYDAKVIGLDRNQHSFKLSFEQFYARRVNGALIARGRSKMKQLAGVLAGIEQRFGVPGAVVVAIWGLETGYGANSGSMPVIRSLATLAYDCRRSQFFQENLTAALKIAQRGDLSPSQMRGAWAGEIGQTQFMAKAYVQYAVDFDGNGRRDLIHSPADVLASTANFLKGHGWQAGGGWGPGSHNYNVLAEWNKAAVYQRTIAVMADKLAGR
jgi:lytic murein transglycosylase